MSTNTNSCSLCVSQVRPFTLGQLKELLNRTGVVMEEGFWIDKIKSHCFVTVSTNKPTCFFLYHVVLNVQSLMSTVSLSWKH